MTKRIQFCLMVLAAWVLPGMAHAHMTADMGGGLMAGFTHPLFGFDHLLAMLSVGIVSTQLKHRHAIWTLPATFVAVMTVGGVIGLSGMRIEGTEIGIGLSVLLLGLSIFFGSQLKPVIIYGFVAFFALCHGYAHGAEMPKQADPTLFASGFVLATAIIHLAGVSLGLFMARILRRPALLQLLGGMIAGVGVTFLIAALGGNAS